MQYTVKRIAPQSSFPAGFNDGIWGSIPELEIANVHAASSAHCPDSRAKCACDGENLYLFFEIKDQYLNAVHKNWNDPVCQDSCVEFFVMPGNGSYINFETNCIGNMLASHVTDWRRINGTGPLAECKMFIEEDFNRIRIFPSLKAPVEDVSEKVDWRMGLIIPLDLIRKYIPEADAASGKVWKANFYKCGGMKGYGHYLSWNPVAEELNFHRPDCFGSLIFE